MTSNDATSELLRNLTFSGAAPTTANASTTFAFTRDFDTAMHWPDVAFDTASPLARYPADDRAAVERIIDGVGTLVGDRAPKAFAFINAHMKTAIVSRSDALSGASSASNRELVGYCLLTNMHIADDRLLVCTEALVHESIHQYLYKIERDRGNFCDLSDGRTYRSPWSGNRIPLHSLIHAALVWYGLLTLWCQLAQSAVSHEESTLMRDKAATVMFGFAFLRPMFASPAFPLTSVQTQVLDLIAHICDLAHAGTGIDRQGEVRHTLRAALESSESGAWLPSLTSRLQGVERALR
jgi:HEXXH motif-containing protein